MKPKANGANGVRGEDGRFQKGNPGGPGNPYAKQVALLRHTIIGAVNPDDIEEIIKAQVNRAKRGDTVAAKFILERVLGRPQVTDLALVAMKARIEEMKTGSSEKQQKQVSRLFDIIS